MVLNKLVEKVGENTMKKLLVILVSLGLMLCMISTLAFGTDVEIEHTVESQSEFQVSGRNISEFKGTSSVEVAKVIVKNNTRDGYNIKLKSAHGALHSATSGNGEEDIPYVLSKTARGESPNSGGGFLGLTIAAAPSKDDVLILGNTAQLSLSTPTDLEFSVKVSITDDGFLDMAGSYTDTLTITYTDI
jgi:hypothetical protein